MGTVVMKNDSTCALTLEKGGKAHLYFLNEKIPQILMANTRI